MYRRVAIAALALVLFAADKVGAQSLEEQTQRPPGTNSLDDGSLQGGDRPDPD